MMDIDTYYHDHFDPGLAVYLSQNMVVLPDVYEVGSNVNFLPSAPGIDGEPTYDLFATDTSGPMTQPAFLWGDLGANLLLKDPYFEPIRSDLVAGGMRWWDSFRDSHEFSPAVEILGLRARSSISLGRKLLDTAKDFGRWAWRGRRLTPTGAGLWVLEQVAGEALIHVGKLGWKEVRERVESGSPNPRPPLKPVTLGFSDIPHDYAPFVIDASRWSASTQPTTVIDALMNIDGVYY